MKMQSSANIFFVFTSERKHLSSTRILEIYLASCGSVSITVSTNALYRIENFELYKKTFLLQEILESPTKI